MPTSGHGERHGYIGALVGAVGGALVGGIVAGVGAHAGLNAAHILEEAGFVRYLLLLTALGVVLGAGTGCWLALHSSRAIRAGHTTLLLAILSATGIGVVVFPILSGVVGGADELVVAATLGVVAMAALVARYLALR
jgi:hypothetical protein